MRRIDSEASFHLLSLLYDSADKPELWPDFLSALSTATGAASAALVLHDLVSKSATGVTHGIEPRQLQLYFDRYASLNPWLPKDDRPRADGPIIRGEQVIQEAQFRRTEFYADWARRNEVVHSMIANLGLGDRKLLYLSINRGEKAGPHPREAESLLNSLLPHLYRVLRQREALDLGQTLRNTLDDLSIAIFVIDQNRKVLDMTPRAEKILDGAGPLRIDSHRILSVHPHEANHAFENCLGVVSRRGQGAADSLRLSHIGGGPDSVLVVTNSTGTFPYLRPKFTLVLVESKSVDPDRLTAAAGLFGLTTAETRLLGTLMNAGSLDRAIANLGISRNTARTQMAAIFAKTGTNRQGEVIRMFASLTPFTHVGDDSRSP